MVELRDKGTGSLVGKISEEQLQFLIDHLEEEAMNDQDYYLNQDTLEFLQDEGMDQELLQMLSRALSGKDEMEIQWVRV